MAPHVVWHVLVRNGEDMLPLYLQCLQEQDYPKEDITLYVRTNDNTDATESIIESWLRWHGGEYRDVIYDNSPSLFRPEFYGNHNWDGGRVDLMRHLRDKGLMTARDLNADFFFTCDVDNFILPETLSSLVELNLPVVAPLLRYAVNPLECAEIPPYLLKGTDYTSANFTNVVTHYGDTQNLLEGGEERFPEGYMDLLYRRNPGVHPVDLVHCCYLVHRDVFGRISYQNGVMGGYEYITFGFNLRYNGIQQYLDNRKNYGCLTMASTARTASLFMFELGDGTLPIEWKPRTPDMSKTPLGWPDVNFHRFVNLVKELLGEEKVERVLDIGACNGNESYFMRDAFPNAEIIAFEPNPYQNAVCRETLGQLSNVKVEQLALTDANGEMKFFASTNLAGCSSLLKPMDDFDVFPINYVETTVEAKRYDDYKSDNGLSSKKTVIWMDVQGNELNTLKGFGDAIDDVEIIYTEVGLKPYYEGHTLAQDIQNYLETRGFVLHTAIGYWEYEANAIFVKKYLTPPSDDASI